MVEELGFPSRGVPDGLVVQRITKSKNLEAAYLPLEEDDPRDFGGGARGGKKRRVRRKASTGTPDPYEAAQKAIAWAKQDLADLKAQKKEQAQQDEKSLFHYWETWFESESRKKRQQRGFEKWARERNRLWSAEGYGVKHQPFAKKAVTEITFRDFSDYWTLLDERSLTRGNATNGGATKKDLRTLINHLLKAAREKDYPALVLPQFPEITHQRHPRDHFTRKEWDSLISKVIDLSGGAARQDLTPEQYAELPSAFKRIDSQRNWVDLYDALCLMWFFHLRLEDLPRLKAEWFKAGEGEDQVICTLEETKQNRDAQRTENPRPDGYRFWERLTKRKPTGYLVFPQKERPGGDPVRSSVLPDIRHLFKHLKAVVQPPITRSGVEPKQTRHTAFRLLVEEDFEFYSTPEGLADLAYQGNTSTDELRSKYLEPVRRERNAAKGRKRLKPATWSNIKRVGDDF
ncbi:hypothetical protein [Synechococcus sp. UW69]|uniref:hypothetical protein n=1 Tax=Synechococcus sp. UW69 TaxID=368493 RepID=UPI000E0FBC87|nr:hypothetical protein [Synechococcus sp. UW69]